MRLFRKTIACAAALMVTALSAMPIIANPVSRTVEAEIIAGYDFAVYQQQGADFTLKYDDTGHNFESRKNDPARFGFSIETTSDTLSACKLHFITWQKPASAQARRLHNTGRERLDESFQPGLAGYLTADKTVYTGSGAFTFSVSEMQSDITGPGSGAPANAVMAAEIASLLRVTLSPLKFSNPLPNPVAGGPAYDFSAPFSDSAARANIKWLGVSDNWGTPNYNIYSLSCTDLITIEPTPIGEVQIWPLIAAALILLGGLGVVLARRSAAKAAGHRVKPAAGQNLPRAKPQKPEESGVIFPGSALAAGAIAPGAAAPLAPAGTMVPAGLQTLTGMFAALKPAYRATGRIGGPQEGVPTNDDVAFGTGFLISPNHVMTNQHVWEFYKHYLAGKDCGGIEFIAERDNDASDYAAFNGDPPVIIADLDIAIFTLARAVTDRTPIDRIAAAPDGFDGRDIVTVSYPCPFETDETILAVVEPDPIFAVKRLSQGKVFRHTTDTDTPYGVAVKVDKKINAAGTVPAICHNASTLGGSSGAPVLDMRGRLVGVHFAGKRIFNDAEAANLAMAIDSIAAIKI